MKQRVGITGIGVVSPVGSGRERFWHALVAGHSGVRQISLFDVAEFPVRMGGQVDDLNTTEIARLLAPEKCERDRKVLLGLVAAAEAVEDSGLTGSEIHHARLHVGVGLEAFFLEDLTPIAHATDSAAALAQASGRGHQPVSVQTPLDRLAQIIGERYGITGGRITNCSACAAGAQAIGEAFRAVREGVAEIAVAGAADSMLNPLGLGGFSLLRVLSTENDRPKEACRPFDGTRQGTVLGEGAGFLVLESLEHAHSRNAHVYAEILGYGRSMDAFRVSDPEPSGRGAVLSMSKALRDAALEPSEIDCISAHGTGTPKNDVVETSAIKEVFGDHARRIPVHAVKSMTGHMIAASGAVEAVAAALTIHHGQIPPTINLRTPDPECDLDYVPNVARPFSGRTCLSNSFGFGGQNATLIFGRGDG
jgi:3-oxoacyl-[acyl-carrier-protein] synthase II